MKEKAFNNWRHNAIHLTFPNGNMLSTTWAYLTYSDNNDLQDNDPFNRFMQSNTCEVMILKAPDKLIKSIYRKLGKYEGDPMGYLTMDEWLYVVKRLSK